MLEEKYTRCPGCRTIFRVTPAQLEARAGKVRCGHCRVVFDGGAHLISLAPRQRSEEPDVVHDEAAQGPPTITLRDARALEPAPDAAATAAGEPAAQPATVPEGVAEIPYEERFAWARRTAPRRERSVVYVVAIPLLVLLLAGQATLHFRDAIAARWPAARPALTRACEFTGCAIRPLVDETALWVAASDLDADPAHRGLLILSATIRNRATWPLAYPALELTLTDAQQQVVVRRVLLPPEYAGGTADLATGIPGNSEVPVKLFIDASAVNPAGYQIYLFYP